MSEQQDLSAGDGINDAIAATAVIALIVTAVVYWLGGMAG